LDLRQQYVDAVCRETGVRSRETEVRSIYLGGGTPSQLTIPQLRQIFDTLYKYNNVAEDAEITIEVNPDDVTEAFAENLRTLPVNRVSMGAQTFNDQRLRYLHRRHTAAQVAEAVERLRAAGIRNISIDLMYGFPDETLNNWAYDIDAALALHVEHLSAYCLSIEEGTPLHRMMNGHNGNSHPCVLPDEETERAMYYLLKDRLESAGLEHYEISNFARPGFRSRHNSAYWNYTPYIGLGAAAHSFDGHTRSWNVADIHQYIKGIERGERLFDSETIEGDTRYNDLLTTALRTREGLDLNLLSDRQRDYCLRCARRFIDDGLLSMHLGHLALTRRGLFISDMIISSLMLVTSESTSC
jgi:oxygen-independent coproporphyrinogen-3 oxidase